MTWRASLVRHRSGGTQHHHFNSRALCPVLHSSSNDRYWGNRRLQPKSASSPIPTVHRADLERQQRVRDHPFVSRLANDGYWRAFETFEPRLCALAAYPVVLLVNRRSSQLRFPNDLPRAEACTLSAPLKIVSWTARGFELRSVALDARTPFAGRDARSDLRTNSPIVDLSLESGGLF
jgi:hypothetical protein